MYFIDVQGTLISDEDKSKLKGSCELINHLNEQNIAYVVLTNNSKDIDFLAYLRKLGLCIKDGAYLDPIYLLRKKKLEFAEAFGPKAFKEVLNRLNIKEKKDANHIILTNWDGYDANDLASLLSSLQRGAKMIAMNATSIYSKNSKLYPGSGSIIAMLKACLDFELEILGKPSFDFFHLAFELLKAQNEHASFDKICMISDDFRADLLAAKELGMSSVLVLSGKIKNTKSLSQDELLKLDGVYEDLGEFLKEIKC